jgi:BlaR1 peptidase M56
MLTYFLQVNLCWLMFYGLYYALLSRETFFKLNRIYLIISLLCGLVIPFSIPTVAVTTTSPMIEIVQPIVISMVEIRDNIETNIITPEAATWTLWTVLKGVYILGMMLLFVKFFIGLNKIFHLYKTGEKEIRDIFKLIKTPKTKSPFSFFNLIFINQKTTEDVDYQQIIEHEKAHVIQKHSFDIVGLEILRGLFWLSPLVHLYARSLRNVHEYLADAAVLQNTEKQQYGRLLISQTTAGSGLVIANHLNFSQLKKRIIMMTRNESQRLMLVKYTLALPLFALLVFAFTLPNNPLMRNTEGVAEKVEKTVQSVDNQLFKKNNNKPEVTVKGTEEGWILKQDLDKVTSLEINEGFEIIRFTMVLGVGFEPEPNEAYVNQGATFNKTILERIKKGKVKSGFRFIDIWIKDLKTNEKYIYGDSYLTITDKIPYAHINAFKGLKVGKIDGVILSPFEKIDIKDISKLDKLILDYKSIDSVRVSINSNTIPVESIVMKNEGLVLTESTKNFLKQAKVGQSIIFTVSGKGYGNEYWGLTTALNIIDSEFKESPYTLLPKGNRGGNIDVEELKKIDYLIAKTTENGETRALKVVKFKVTLRPSIRSNQEIKEVINQGANFKTELKALLASAKSFDQIIFSDVQIFDTKQNKTVAAEGMEFQILPDYAKYPIPNPSVTIANVKAMPRDLFANMAKLDLQQPDYKAQIHCDVQSFSIIRKSSDNSDSKQTNNIAASFKTETLNMIQQAKIGDVYEFQNIKVRCPGDVKARALDGFSITITE